MVAAYGMPRSMWVAWFSPSVKRSRMTAHEASFEIVDSIPCFLKSPSSWAITSEEQSVSAMIPILTFGASGPSAAYTPPAQLPGTPARSAAVVVVVLRNCRRVTSIRPPDTIRRQKKKRRRASVRGHSAVAVAFAASVIDARCTSRSAADVPAASRSEGQSIQALTPDSRASAPEVLPNFSAGRVVLLNRRAAGSALARQAHAILRDPAVHAPGHGANAR